MSIQRVIGILVAVVLLFFVIAQPVASAEIVRNIFDALAEAADSVIVFVRNLF